MALKSWLSIPRDSHFSLRNLPFGIITTASDQHKRAGVAIGNHCLDLRTFASLRGFTDLDLDAGIFGQSTLNAFAEQGRECHRRVRKYLQDVFRQDTPYPSLLKDSQSLQQKCLIPLSEVTMHLPMQIGDYTDFYAGKNHAFNVGCLFRGPANALQPNYTHLPVGYHGRASSVVVSGTPIRRPRGQILLDPTAEVKQPVLAPSKRLDIELELGAFLCKSNAMGEAVPIADAEDSIFGLVLLNDWSARDIQAWEYVPLGPFNAKNFGTSISPWVVLIDALAAFKTEGIPHEKQLLPYLQEGARNVYDIELEIELRPSSGRSTTISRTNGRHLLYSFPQMLAHHTVGGCPMNVGDLLGSGTISGTVPGSEGAMLEITKGGKEKIRLVDGTERTFLEDGDTVVLRGVCGTEDTGLVGFGECMGTILPALRQ